MFAEKGDSQVMGVVCGVRGGTFAEREGAPLAEPELRFWSGRLLPRGVNICHAQQEPGLEGGLVLRATDGATRPPDR